MGKALAKRVKCTILYATETGKSERFAKYLAEIFNHAFDSKVIFMFNKKILILKQLLAIKSIYSLF